MEHRFAPYIVRCFQTGYINHNDKAILHDNIPAKHYPPLGDINNKDLFEMLAEYLQSKQSDIPTVVKNENTMFQISNLEILPDNRVISGYIRKGAWGQPAKIYNSTNPQALPRDLAHTDAVLHEYFFYFYIPLDRSEGICIFHKIGNGGVKEIFMNAFKEVFHAHSGLTLQCNPIQFGEIYQKWQNAVLKEIRVAKFGLPTADITEQLNNIIPNPSVNLVIKAAHYKNPIRTTLAKFFQRDSEEAKLVELFEKEYHGEVSCAFNLEGRQRILKVGSRQSTTSDIILEASEISQENGELDHTKLLNLAQEITNDIVKRIY